MCMILFSRDNSNGFFCIKEIFLIFLLEAQLVIIGKYDR
jgi:hypothetical protein